MHSALTRQSCIALPWWPDEMRWSCASNSQTLHGTAIYAAPLTPSQPPLAWSVYASPMCRVWAMDEFGLFHDVPCFIECSAAPSRWRRAKSFCCSASPLEANMRRKASDVTKESPAENESCSIAPGKKQQTSKVSRRPLGWMLCLDRPLAFTKLQLVPDMYLKSSVGTIVNWKHGLVCIIAGYTYPSTITRTISPAIPDLWDPRVHRESDVRSTLGEVPNLFDTVADPRRLLAEPNPACRTIPPAQAPIGDWAQIGLQQCH